MAKRGPNGTKLNGKPEYPYAENADFPGTPIEFDTGNGIRSFRWCGRYFPGAMRKCREGKREDAIERQATAIARRVNGEGESKSKSRQGGTGARKRRVERRQAARQSNANSDGGKVLWDRIAVMDYTAVADKDRCTCIASLRPRTTCICK